MNIYFDTEDNSETVFAGKDRSIEETKRQRQVTLVCAIAEDGDTFTSSKATCCKAFQTWLIEKQSAAKVKLRVYALNLQYDLGNIFWGKLDSYQPEFVGGRLLQAQWTPNISFHDVGNLWKSSVKDMGDSVGLPKLERAATSAEYCMRDVEIIKRGHEYILDMARRYGVTKVGNTMGGLTVKMFKAMGGVIWHNSNQWFLEGFYGGRTEMFREEVNGYFRKIDVTSMYPSVMLGPFPAEFDVNKEADFSETEYGMTEVLISVPELPVCPLPVKTYGANAYPMGVFRGTWTNHEIRYAEAMGCKIMEVYESYGTNEIHYPFKEYILRMFGDRKNAKTKAEKDIIKLFMNSLFGQMAQKGDNLTKGISIHSQEFLKMYEAWRATQSKEEDAESMLFERYGTHVLMPKVTPPPEHTNYLLAAYITSYARIKLLDAMLDVGAEKLVYCDTDSIFYESEQALIKESTEGELGGWSLEASGNGKLRFYQPKSYLMDWNGFDEKNKVNKFGEHSKTFAKGVKKDSAREYLDKGKVTVTIPFRMKEAMRAYGSEIILDGKPLSLWYEKLMELKGGLRANAQYQRVKDFDNGRWKPKNFIDLETNNS
jgi:hypothetical protein